MLPVVMLHVEQSVHGDLSIARQCQAQLFRKSLAAFPWWAVYSKRCLDRTRSSSSSVLRERACRFSSKSSKCPAVMAPHRRSGSMASPATGCSCEKCPTNTKHGHGQSSPRHCVEYDEVVAAMYSASALGTQKGAVLRPNGEFVVCRRTFETP